MEGSDPITSASSSTRVREFTRPSQAPKAHEDAVAKAAQRVLGMEPQKASNLGAGIFFTGIAFMGLLAASIFLRYPIHQLMQPGVLSEATLIAPAVLAVGGVTVGLALTHKGEQALEEGEQGVSPELQAAFIRAARRVGILPPDQSPEI